MQRKRFHHWKAHMVFLFAAMLSHRAAGDIVPCNLVKEQSKMWLLPNLPVEFWKPTGALRKVRDGLALTIDRRAQLLTRDGGLLGVVGATCRLMYDIWEDSFLLVDLQESTRLELKFGSAKSLEALKRCVSLSLPQTTAALAHVQVLINPVDSRQEERTRDWLATKGIGGTGAGIMGRAMGAVINLKTESTVEHDCKF